MENGLPSQAVVAINRPGGFVYDWLSSRQVAATAGERPAVGRRRPRPVRRPAVHGLAQGGRSAFAFEAPATIARGAKASCRIEVLDPEGRPLEAVVPLRVTIRDSEGRAAEFSGYYAAVDGKTEIPLDIASNDPMGVWQIEVRELASGQTAVHSFRVPGPNPWPPRFRPLPKELRNAVQPKG